MIIPIPGPGTHPHDWMPDYIPAHPYRAYNPRRPVAGGDGHRKGHDRPGRPIGGKASEHRRAQWRNSKRRSTEDRHRTADAEGAT